MVTERGKVGSRQLQESSYSLPRHSRDSGVVRLDAVGRGCGCEAGGQLALLAVYIVQGAQLVAPTRSRTDSGLR